MCSRRASLPFRKCGKYLYIFKMRANNLFFVKIVHLLWDSSNKCTNFKQTKGYLISLSSQKRYKVHKISPQGLL